MTANVLSDIVMGMDAAEMEESSHGECEDYQPTHGNFGLEGYRR